MLKDDVLELISKKNFVELKKQLAKTNPVDIAEVLQEMDIHSSLIVFRLLSKDDAVEVFANIPPEKQLELTKSFTDDEIREVVNELYLDDMVDMLEEMPALVVKKILKNATEQDRKLINQFLSYPEKSAGSLITIEYVELKKDMNVNEALQVIRDEGIMKETIYTCYVTDEYKKLIGCVSLRKLVTSKTNAKIQEIMESDIISVTTVDDQEKVADIFLKYGFMVLPVVDHENRMCGIITVDDVMDVMEKEATEDFQKMAAIAPNEARYLDTPVIMLAKDRIMWLMILMISATFTGKIMQKYNTVIQSVIILNMFIPMIMDSGGNAGSQSSTLIIRGLATGEIGTKDWFKVFWKEFRVSSVVGFALGSVNFLKCILIDKVSLDVGILVSITLMLTIMMAKMVGGLLPIGAKKMNMDPAIMAGPLITTIVDAMGLLVYFQLAKMLLGI